MSFARKSPGRLQGVGKRGGRRTETAFGGGGSGAIDCPAALSTAINCAASMPSDCFVPPGSVKLTAPCRCQACHPASSWQSSRGMPVIRSKEMWQGVRSGGGPDLPSAGPAGSSLGRAGVDRVTLLAKISGCEGSARARVSEEGTSRVKALGPDDVGSRSDQAASSAMAIADVGLCSHVASAG